jgi:putative two-component system response regulator
MIDRTYADAQIMLIDHEPATVGSLSQALQSAGYPLPQGILDPLQVPLSLENAHPDLVVFDVCLPGIDSYALLDSLTHQLPQDVFLPILAVGQLLDPEIRQRAMGAGAKDFLAKPIDVEEFLLHVHSLLDTRFVHLRLQETRGLLEDLVQRRTSELRQAQLETLELLGRVAEVRDDATGQHTKRVGHLSGLIARELRLPREQAELIMRAAPLHDIGKVAIADAILLKNGGFEALERESMRRHATLGAELLGGARSDLLRMAGTIAAYHHERWDGQGYPHHLRAEAIPLAARIVAVADAFDALTHARPYKEAWSVREALAEIQRERGWQFDPQVVDALLQIQRRQRHIVHVARDK